MTITVLAFLIASPLFLCVALLERCEKHLRELHVRALGPLSPEDRTPEGRAARRAELGLDDGYPHRQIYQAIGLAVFMMLLAWWKG